MAVYLDMSNVSTEEQALIRNLQESGKLPVPLVYANHEVVSMIDDEFELPDDASSVRIDVGVSKFIERPLYSFTWQGADRVSDVSITSAAFASYKVDQTKNALALVLSGISTRRINAKVVENGLVEVSLPAEPYVFLANLVATADPKTPWLERPVLEVYQKDYVSGETIEPVILRYGSPAKVLMASASGTLPRTYNVNIDASWFKDAQALLEAKPADRLLVKSVPSNAQIWLSGVQQSNATDSEVVARQDLWPQIFVRKDKFNSCRVDASLVQAPSQDGEPYTYICKLSRK
jgi:hypothetical protein